MPKKNNKYLTLAGANIIIADYLKTGNLIPPHEKEFLLQIENRIRAITTTQRGWLKAGIIANANNFDRPITQEDIINEARLAQQNTIGFTWITVNKLMTDIQAETNNAHTHSFINLLSDIQKCCECVLDNIKKNISVKESKDSTEPEQIETVKLLVEESIFYSTNNAVQMIQLLNGRIFPFSQGYDPLRGKDGIAEENSGYCHGYVKSWCKEISRHGHASTLPRVDNEVHDFQQNQSNPIIPTWISDYFAKTDFRVLLSQMLNHIQADHTYGLGLNSKHILGIRYIKSKHIYEMFDPNLGIIVFNNKENFITFLAFLHVNVYNKILSAYNKHHHNDIVLFQYDKQPKNSIPSIPISSDSNEKSDVFNHLDFTLAYALKNETADICNKKVTGKLGIKNDRLTIALSAFLTSYSFSIMSLLLTDMNPENTPLSTRLQIFYTCAMLGAIPGAIYGATSYTPRILIEKTGTYVVNKLMELIEHYSNKNETKHVPNNRNNVQSTQQILSTLPPTSPNTFPVSSVNESAPTNTQHGALFQKITRKHSATEITEISGKKNTIKMKRIHDLNFYHQ